MRVLYQSLVRSPNTRLPALCILADTTTFVYVDDDKVMIDGVLACLSDSNQLVVRKMLELLAAAFRLDAWYDN